MSMYYYNTKLSNISKPYSYLKKKKTLTNLQSSLVVTQVKSTVSNPQISILFLFPNMTFELHVKISWEKKKIMNPLNGKPLFKKLLC